MYLARGCAFIISLLLVVDASSLALGQEKSRADREEASRAHATPTAPVAPGSPERTGKERLGEKWMDEQRVDNCNVPRDKRGARPRPDACPGMPTH